MVRFLLNALVAIALVFSATMTRKPALARQHQIIIQPEQSPQKRLLEERSESGRSAGGIQEKRVALIIGNGSYVGANPLRNPPNDARSISAALRQIGFDVIERIDLNSREMKRAVIEFGNKLRSNDVGLFYYAGHGVQSNGKNYLIPVDAEIEKEADIVVDGVELDTVMAQIEGAKNRLNIVILDACRNDFSSRGWNNPNRGLLQVANAPSGLFIAYATAPGSTASDNISGQNGLYTQELLKAMRQPGLRIEEVFKQVRLRVRELSKGQQIPWESSSLEGEFFFIPANSKVASSNTSSSAGGHLDNPPTTPAPNSGALKSTPNITARIDSNSPPSPINSGRNWDSIQRKIDGGLYDEAIKEALDYLESQPDDPQVNYLLGLSYIQKQLFPGGFRYISKAVEGGIPVMFDFVEHLTNRQGTLKVQKDCLEIQFNKTTTQVPYNLVRDISPIQYVDLYTWVSLKVGVNEKNKIKQKTFSLTNLVLHNYPMTSDYLSKSNSGGLAIQDAWARSFVGFINDIKARAQ